MVRADGLEPALAALRRAGVYVSFEEWKGRRRLVRGDLELDVDTHSFDNPHLRKVYEGSTGGSTGVGTRLALDLDDIAARAPITLLAQEAHGILGLPRATVFGRLPDPTAINSILGLARMGRTIEPLVLPRDRGREADADPVPFHPSLRGAGRPHVGCRGARPRAAAVERHGEGGEVGGAGLPRARRCRDLVERQHGGSHRHRGPRGGHRPHGGGDDERR